MRHRLTVLLSVLHGYLLVLLLLSLPVTFIYPQDHTFWLRGLAILIPVAVSAYGIRRFKHLYFYLLAMVVCAAAAFFWSITLPERVYLTAASILVFLIRIPDRLNRKTDLLMTPGLLCLLVFLLVYFAGLLIPLEPLCLISYRLAFLYLLVLILYTNFSQMNLFFSQNKEIANLPGKQILSTNRVMLTLFTVAALLGMIALPASGIGNVIPYIGKGLLWLVRKFFSLFSSGGSEEIPEVIEPATQSGPQEMLPPVESGPTWLTYLLDALAYVFFTVIVLAALAGIIYGIVQLFRRFYQPIRENSDEQEFIHEEKADLSAFSMHREKEPSLRFQFRPSASIRKLYKKTLKKSAASKKIGELPAGFTPAELEQLTNVSDMLPNEEAAGLLHSLYEKARYGQTECTREDVSSLHSAGIR